MERRKFLSLPVAAIPLMALKSSAAQTKPKNEKFPLVVSTWESADTVNAAAWEILKKGGRALDAVEKGANTIEDQITCCVGLGANPDRDGFVTLDASIMDENANCGSVAFLRHIDHPSSVARLVMEKTPHVLLVGEGAEKFALENGFQRKPEKLSPKAEEEYKKWLKKSDYKPKPNIESTRVSVVSDVAPRVLSDGGFNHDTMGTIALDSKKDLSGVCTTSGMAFKMHGRVGDSPIIGSGLFVDNEVGAAVATGVGEEVIRICGTHLIIELMRNGTSPRDACKEAIRRIVKRDPKKAKEFQVAFIAISKSGEYGAFSILEGFPYFVTNQEFPNGKMIDSEHFL